MRSALCSSHPLAAEMAAAASCISARSTACQGHTFVTCRLNVTPPPPVFAAHNTMSSSSTFQLNLSRLYY